MTTRPRWAYRLLEAVLVAALYVVLTRVGFALAFANSQVSPVWPPEGLALAAILLRGPHLFWGIALGAAAGNYINLPDLPVSLAIGAGNALGALLNVWLIRRFIGRGTEIMTRVRNVLAFMVLCTPFGGALSATIGVTALLLGGYAAPGDYAWTWLTWWFGEMQGYLIVGTAFIVWSTRPPADWSFRKWGELVALAASLVAIGPIVFSTDLPITYLPIPLLIWAAFRFRQHGAILAIVALSGEAILRTVNGEGPFAVVREGILQLNDSLILLQAYLVFVSLTAFVLVATVAELQESEGQKERMEAELAVGREIQLGMVPPPSLEMPACAIQAVLRPAREVSGDFYDYFLADDGRLCVIVGDVSGKGVPAALFMARTSTLLRSMLKAERSVGEVVTRVNQLLREENEQMMFVTVFAAIVDLETGGFSYTNAGHNPSYLMRAGGSLERLEERHGGVIGVRKNARYGDTAGLLGAGDVLVAYTDGVVEAMDPAEQLFTEARFRELLASFPERAPRAVVQGIVAAVERFEEGKDPADDTTILALQYRGGLAAGSAERAEPADLVHALTGAAARRDGPEGRHEDGDEERAAFSSDALEEG